MKRFAEAIKRRFNLELQWSKSSIFTWSGIPPSDVPNDVKIAGKMIENEFQVGFDCYGIPIGTD